MWLQTNCYIAYEATSHLRCLLLQIKGWQKLVFHKTNDLLWNSLDCVVHQWCSQPKTFLGRPKRLILGEQQYFVWDAASQSTKWLDMLKIWGGPWPLGYAYEYVVHERHKLAVLAWHSFSWMWVGKRYQHVFGFSSNWQTSVHAKCNFLQDCWF